MIKGVIYQVSHPHMREQFTPTNQHNSMIQDSKMPNSFRHSLIAPDKEPKPLGEGSRDQDSESSITPLKSQMINLKSGEFCKIFRIKAQNGRRINAAGGP
ncbi:hypothetical protein TorRG33x02_168640 [Trema orientale]|uniref:Uncharacterized protein n=1 Tax=Trema orientale TaxID=63057 RepID=A0A2P5EPE1_TREOI|nr:hypothetical protein TorRG33x02_168640 [Trema orientale]